VLVVDDEDDSREVLCKFLAGGGMRLSALARRAEGIGRARARAPDLIPLDLLMPGMDGPNFLGVLRSYSGLRHVPVIVLTAAPTRRHHLLGCHRRPRRKLPAVVLRRLRD
jgi:CheY-like chemotaxis protein